MWLVQKSLRYSTSSHVGLPYVHPTSSQMAPHSIDSRKLASWKLPLLSALLIYDND